MINRPLVSVIIPAFNMERYLAEAVQSVLAQPYQPIEIIIVDDGSTDRTAEIAQRFELPARYVHQVHTGTSQARNHGVELAQGEFIAFLDADDIWLEDKLSLQLAAFEAQPELDMVFGHVTQFLSPDLAEAERDALQYSIEPTPGYLADTLLIRRAAFERAGFFETNWRVGEFIDWYLKAQEAGLSEVLLTNVLVRRRLHANNTGRRERAAQTDYARILKRALDRRRLRASKAGR